MSAWQTKQACSLSAPKGLPSSKCAKAQPPVDAYLRESLTMNWTPFFGPPATKDWGRPFTTGLDRHIVAQDGADVVQLAFFAGHGDQLPVAVSGGHVLDSHLLLR